MVKQPNHHTHKLGASRAKGRASREGKKGAKEARKVAAPFPLLPSWNTAAD